MCRKRKSTEACGKSATEAVTPREHKRLHFANISDSSSSSDVDLGTPVAKSRTQVLSYVAFGELAHPRSAFAGWEPPLPVSDERAAVRSLLAADVAQHHVDESEWIFIRLDQFSIYRTSLHHEEELAPLDRLQNRGGYAEMRFDGVLSYAGQRYYVERAPFSTLTIDGYCGTESLELEDGAVCIQSPMARRIDRRIFYQLGKPSPEYRRFHQPFLWLAHFTKFFVEYLQDFDRVTLSHFEHSFFKWLHCRQTRSNVTPFMDDWLEQCKLTDFRTTVAANVGFLWKETFSVDPHGIRSHPLWHEVDPKQLFAIQEEQTLESQTVVTPFAYQCFRHMYFATHLDPQPITDPIVREKVGRRKLALGLTPLGHGRRARSRTRLLTPQHIRDDLFDMTCVKKGDVLRMLPEENSIWKSSVSFWYAYVQDSYWDASRDRPVFDVLWLYQPCDTTIGKAQYPFENELFLSDNCDCGKDALDATSFTFLGKANISWLPPHPPKEGLFVRQKFRTISENDTYDFVKLKPTDFFCECKQHLPIFEECLKSYNIGDCVLVREWSRKLQDSILEPAQIIQFLPNTEHVLIRRFTRKCDINPDARPNELTCTRIVVQTDPSMIIRRCHVRYVKVGDKVPTPYDRDGTGDLFYIFKDEQADGVDDDEYGKLPPLRMGWDPSTQAAGKSKLHGMGLFCGGGNFDRGLEEGGAVDFLYAVDWATAALHSYRANSKNPNAQFFLGSVSDYLARAFRGCRSSNVAKVGSVNVLAAGSPCPGFSALTTDRTQPLALRNASMVASVISFVDLYSPEYLVLENVVNMTAGMGPNKDENVFSQVLAALVSMGYQTQQFLMPAWSFGSSQQRKRLFIVASTPGLEPLPLAPYTHASPEASRTNISCLGKSSNGLEFGVLRNEYTPFPHVSPAAATRDLPALGDAQVAICPPFPDHRAPTAERGYSRSRMAAVPVRPAGMGIVQAAMKGRLVGEALSYVQKLRSGQQKHKRSRTYSRIYGHGLFPTIVTAMGIACGRSGRSLHWNEHRTITVLEARRAQGFLDSEVLVGTPTQQYKIIGNSVDRKVALALGLMLRQSWESSAMELGQTSSKDSGWRS